MVPSPVSWPGMGWRLSRPSLIQQLCALDTPDLLAGPPSLPLQMGTEAWASRWHGERVTGPRPPPTAATRCRTLFLKNVFNCMTFVRFKGTHAVLVPPYAPTWKARFLTIS